MEGQQRQAAAVTIGELDFAVDQYIVIGSPLGLFLALRKVLNVFCTPNNQCNWCAASTRCHARGVANTRHTCTKESQV